MLRRFNISHVYLVTHAWHMPRAQRAFERAGLRVTPAPTAFTTLDRAHRGWLGYLPSTHGLSLSSIALREKIGSLYYESRK